VTAVADLDLPAFDHTDASLRGEEFHEAMVCARGRGWLAQGPFGYITLDREAGEFFLRSRSATFPGMKIAEIFGVTDGPLYEQMVRNILHINGPDHSRLRGLVNPALTPRAVERYRPAMRGFLAELLAAARSSAGGGDVLDVDFVTDFARPYPSQVIATVMGAPLADAPRLHHWSNWIQRQFDAVAMATEREGIEQAVAEFYEYATALVAARRDAPGDDMVSLLVAAEDQGDRLSDVECVNLVFNILVGGVDTTQAQFAHAVRLLAEHADQWRALREDPALAPAAVEEALRFEPITPFTARILTEEVTYRGVSFPKDTVMMICAFTGNRDLPDDDIESFDITAGRDATRPLTFGAGVHYCLGANLARLELSEGLAFLATNAAGVELMGKPSYETITGIYGLASLPLRITL